MMRDRGPSTFTVGATLLALAVLVTYLSFAKDVPFVNEPYEIKAAFRDSAGIKPHSPVRIAGVEVGEVTGVQHTSPGSQAATVTLAIRDDGRPVRANAAAKIRPRIFLEGNFFVDLVPGSRGAELDDGATIPAARTTTPVQFDQVLSALKSDTRNDLATVFDEVGEAQDAGGAKAFNDSLKYQPAAYKFTAIVAEALLGKQPGDLGDWVRDQGVVSGALDADPVKLRSLVVDFNKTAGALADRESALTAAVGELPRTLRAATPAFDQLRAAFPDVRRFALGARPGVRSLGPTVDALLPLTKQLRGLVRPAELRGLARQLHAATPPLAKLAKTLPGVFSELRSVSSCAAEVIVPFGNDTLVDKAFPTTRPRLPGAREVPAQPRWREPLVRRQQPVVQGPRRRRRGDAEPRQRDLRLGARTDRRQQPAARPHTPRAASRRAVRDAGAARTCAPRRAACQRRSRTRAGQRGARGQGAGRGGGRRAQAARGHRPEGLRHRRRRSPTSAPIARRNGLSEQLERTLRGSAKP